MADHPTENAMVETQAIADAIADVMAAFDTMRASPGARAGAALCAINLANAADLSGTERARFLLACGLGDSGPEGRYLSAALHDGKHLPYTQVPSLEDEPPLCLKTVRPQE